MNSVPVMILIWTVFQWWFDPNMRFISNCWSWYEQLACDYLDMNNLPVIVLIWNTLVIIGSDMKSTTNYPDIKCLSDGTDISSLPVIAFTWSLLVIVLIWRVCSWYEQYGSDIDSLTMKSISQYWSCMVWTVSAIILRGTVDQWWIWDEVYLWWIWYDQYDPDMNSLSVFFLIWRLV